MGDKNKEVRRIKKVLSLFVGKWASIGYCALHIQHFLTNLRRLQDSLHEKNSDWLPTYKGEIDMLKTWIGQRHDWLDKNMPNIGACADALPGGAAEIELKTNPNPFTCNLSVQVKSRTSQLVSVRVLDLRGRSILTKDFNIIAGENILVIPAYNWIKGIYIIRFFFSDGEKAVRKVVKN